MVQVPALSPAVTVYCLLSKIFLRNSREQIQTEGEDRFICEGLLLQAGGMRLSHSSLCLDFLFVFFDLWPVP